ncbi:MAG: pentapeptide repeat-containing protein [Clostridia bacterium]|nr:pentapeptide repeat-containing protein [Clostridia bacterium]
MKEKLNEIKQLINREKFLFFTSFLLIASIITSFVFLVCSYKPLDENSEVDNVPVVSYEDTSSPIPTTTVNETNQTTKVPPAKGHESVQSKDEQNSKPTNENALSSTLLEESTINETTSTTEPTTQNDLYDKDDSEKRQQKDNAELLNNIFGKLQNYFDIIVDLTTAIIVSFFGVIVTVFVFLKSALDRIIDENQYISDIANIYKESTAMILFYVCIVESLALILTLIWHAYLSFACSCNQKFVSFGLMTLILSLLFSLIISGWFCKRCIGIEAYLRRIILLECGKLKNKLEKLMNGISDENNMLNVIGDWYEWEDKYEENKGYIQDGRILCQNMTVDQYINLFFRAEMLLLSGEQGYDKREEHNSDVIAILQERINILKPNSKVEKEDLKNRYYLSREKTNINNSIETFEKNIKYNNSSNSSYFIETQKLYDYLRKYRNYLISWRYTEKKIESKNKQNKLDNIPESVIFRNSFSRALYYFVLRLLGTFVCATHISDFSFNGFSLNFANFYNSTLERLTLYSSEFYRTVFARAQISQSEMDISLFYDVDFYGTTFVDSSLSNSKFNFVKYDGTHMLNTDLSSSDFYDCIFTNSDFENCLFNNTDFERCIIEFSKFPKSKFKDISCDCFIAKGCDFQYSILQNWKGKTEKNDNLIKINDCNFSYSTWQKMAIIDGDLSGSVFTNSEFIDVYFNGTKMKSVLFFGSNLTSTKITNCNLKYGSMEKAILVAARFYKVKMNMGNLGEALAVNAQFRKCSFADSNCAEADFSRAYFYSCNFQGARLYDCSMMKTKLRKCNCKHLLADHLQFTFAKCYKTDFSESSLAESNLTKTIFEKCNFDYSDIKASNASGTQFNNCSLNYVDFSNTRFVESKFLSKDVKLIFKNSNFKNCTFEDVSFENVFFENCLFENSTFVNCEYLNKNFKYKKLNKKSFKHISNYDATSIVWAN